MKHKELITEFYPDTGRSVYVFSVGQKIYMGEAFCHPEDAPSSFFGIQLARARAYIDYETDLINDFSARQAELKLFYTTLKQSIPFNEKARHIKQLKARINYLSEKIMGEKKKRDALKEYIKKAPSEREKLIKSIKKKGGKKKCHLQPKTGG